MQIIPHPNFFPATSSSLSAVFQLIFQCCKYAEIKGTFVKLENSSFSKPINKEGSGRIRAGQQ